MGGFKRVSGTVIVGPRGQPMVTRGYTEIGGLRFYDDQLVVGQYGQYVIRSGETEFISPERK